MSDNVYADLVAAQAAEIERLTRERDEALSELHSEAEATQVQRHAAKEARTRADALEAERDALQSAINCRWTDRADHLSAEIDLTHPFKVKDFERWNRAQVLVSNRHSKGSLIALVAYLLREGAKAARLRQALSAVLPLAEYAGHENGPMPSPEILAMARAALGGQP